MPASSGEVIGAALQSVYQHIAPVRQSSTFESLENKSSIADQLIEDIAYDSHGGKKTKLVSKNQVTKLNARMSEKKNSENCDKKMSGGKKDDQLEEPKVVLWSRDRVKLGWQNRNFYQGAGFDNLGNTCYMNSSLQALFHIPALLNWLMEEGSAHIQKCEANTMNSSFCSICAMTRTLRHSLDKSHSSMRPSQIHNKLKCIGKTLLYGRQEDAHEFIKLLLDHMEKSYLHHRKATKLDHRSKETTPLNQIFGGYIRQQVICPLCRYVSTTFSHFQDLVLDIRSVNSVDEALNLHFRKETLDADNAYKCERCHKKVSATKKHLIERAPHVLLLQLKRFTISGGKIGKHINIQKTIDISRFVNGGSVSGSNAKYGPTSVESGGQYQYKLVSMVIHIGNSQHGGHYTAVAQASNQLMYEFDDSMVRTISVQSALLRNPYILFYEMVERPKDNSCSKQVIRQSSAKTLIRQDSSEGASKPLPTSHSSSCVSNGFGKASNDALAETSGRSNPSTNVRSPIKFSLTQKDREKTIIVIGKQNLKGINEIKHNKITLHSSNTNLLGTKSSSQQSSSSSSTVSKMPNEKKCSSLVPYPDDSDDSEHEEKKVANGVIGKSNESLLSKIGKPPASPKAKGEKLNGTIRDSSLEKLMNGEIKLNRKDKLSNGDVTDHKSSTSSTNGATSSKSSAQFLPRTVLQSQVTNKNKLANSSGKVSGNGWHVSEDSSNSTEKINSSNIDSKLANGSDKFNGNSSKTIKEKPEPDGWLVTLCSNRPELEKSHSHDSALPVLHRDEDTTSLKSKASVDSNRSEKSSKSMKKTFFSLISCMSVAASPDPSPNDEDCPQFSDKESTSNIPSKNDSKQARLTEPKPSCSQDSDSEGTPNKRYRDCDTEPSSPSKKCRPEDRLKNFPVKNENSKTNGKDYHGANGGKTWPGHHKSKIGHTSESDKRKCYRTEKDENFSMEEKKSRYKITYSDSDEDSANSENENGSTNRAYSNSARLNPNVNIVQWDQNRTDISKSIQSKNKSSDHGQFNGYDEYRNGAKYENGQYKKGNSNMFEGSKNTSVVDELRRANSFGLGTKVNTWNGNKSMLDKEAEISKRDSKKRTTDELYDDEFDAGRTKKFKNRSYSEITAPKINSFQKVQDGRNNSGYSNGHGNSSLNRSNTWSGQSSSHNHSNGYQSHYNNNSNNHHDNWNNSSPNSYYNRQNGGYNYKFGKSKSWDKQWNNGNKYSGNRPKFNNYNKHGGKEKFRFKNRSRD